MDTDRYLGTRYNYQGGCENLRDANYMCDAVIRDSKPWWTIDGGYCLPFSLPYQILQLDTTNKTNSCTFALKCALSNGLDQSCNCRNPTECGRLVTGFCPDSHRFYPTSGPFLFPHGILLYARDRDWTNKKPDGIELSGRIKCIGYQFVVNGSFRYRLWEGYSYYAYEGTEHHICNMIYTKDENKGLQNSYSIADSFMILQVLSNLLSKC
jgi:hypothetical protein